MFCSKGEDFYFGLVERLSDILTELLRAIAARWLWCVKYSQ